MKMVFVVYNQAIETEVNQCLEECGVKYYTKFEQVFGIGKSSGPHMGTHIWPASNNALLIACDENMKDKIIQKVKEKKEEFKTEGIKAFALPLEEMT